MHCALLGVVRQFVSLLLDLVHHLSPWYLGRHLTILNFKLLTIKPPGKFSRAPHSVSERKFWRATEHKSFLLYYSLFVLMGCYLIHTIATAVYLCFKCVFFKL